MAHQSVAAYRGVFSVSDTKAPTIVTRSTERGYSFPHGSLVVCGDRTPTTDLELPEEAKGVFKGRPFLLSHAKRALDPERPLSELEAIDGRFIKTMGADRNFDTHGLVKGVRELGITTHVACNDNCNRSTWIDGRTTRHSGYAVNQEKRRQIEEHFGWGKTVGGLVQMRTLAPAAGPSG